MTNVLQNNCGKQCVIRTQVSCEIYINFDVLISEYPRVRSEFQGVFIHFIGGPSPSATIFLHILVENIKNTHVNLEIRTILSREFHPLVKVTPILWSR